ncbi:MAG: hypothetical protein HFH14_03225 [Lachnospiraceae bacterium]|nr:hypothetical protein [Lachnospiraceae bacterium]
MKNTYNRIIRKLIMFMIVAVSAACLTYTQAAKIYASQIKGEVDTDSLNVRTGAGTNYDILKVNNENVRLGRGTKVSIAEELAGGWYKIDFDYAGGGRTGYVASMYISTVRDKTVLAQNLKIKAKTLMKTKVNTKPSAKSGAVVYKKKECKLKKGAAVTITGVRKKSGIIWYAVSFKYKKKELTGYIRMADIAVKKGLIQSHVIKKCQVYTKAGNVKKIYKIKKKAVKLKKGKKIKVLKEKNVKKTKWFYIRFNYNGKNVKGWVSSDNIMFTSGQEPVKPVVQPDNPVTVLPLSDAEFEAAMTAEGFPESYKPALRQLHAQYPLWQFKAYNTGLDWNDSVARESVIGKSLIPDTKEAAWKSSAEGAYDYVNDKYIVKDGTNWVCASTQAVSYYMDPRNFLSEKTMFMFETLSYEPAYQTAGCVAQALNGTIYSGASYTYTNETGAQVSKTYQDTFMEAASINGISPVHLVSRMKQEVVTGANSVSNSVTGTVPGFEGIYNFYNIGATDSSTGQAVLNGLRFASVGTTYMRPWNNPYKSIVGGAQYISGNYIKRGQNTLYLQRFNVTPNGTYEHQYMTNVVAAYSESLKAYNAYSGLVASNPFVFYIPIYGNMPETACPAPSGNLSPNNYLSAINVSGGSTGQMYMPSVPFHASDGGKVEYVYQIPAYEGTVTVGSQTINAKASVAGNGAYSLSAASVRIPLSVTAENGSVRTYNIVINLMNES